MIKKIIPYHVKIRLHQLRKGVQNFFSGYIFNYAKKRTLVNSFSKSIQIKQELKPNEAKKHNLLKAIKSIESIEIYPNEIFSFWRVVGKPSERNGFVKSRSLVNGILVGSFGGGLCQLSGLIYYISLYANLEIIERHNHSVDIYNDETRFTPLGSDATVVYGYKDLKVRNNLKKPVKFTFSLTEKTLTVKLKHSDAIEKNIVEFKEKRVNHNEIEVVTIINNCIKNRSIYKRFRS